MQKQLSSRERYLMRASNAYHDQFLNAQNQRNSVVVAGKRYLTSHGVDTSTAKTVKDYKFGVVIEPLAGDERFTGWLAMPYLYPGGNGVKAIRFRNLSGNEPKIGQHKGQGARLYNTKAYFADGAGTIGIAEGEIDAVVATERLGLPTLGIPGAEMWTAHRGIWSPLFKNYQHVLILRDGDKAGNEMADAVSDTLKLRARVIDMPNGEDVSSMVAAGRGEELSKQFRIGADDDDG